MMIPVTQYNCTFTFENVIVLYYLPIEICIPECIIGCFLTILGLCKQELSNCRRISDSFYIRICKSCEPSEGMRSCQDCRGLETNTEKQIGPITLNYRISAHPI